MPDNLPPDQQEAPKPVVQQTPPAETPKPEETPKTQEQSTREWLQSLGIMAADVATREQPRVEREAPPMPEPPREREAPVAARPRRDIDDVKELLKTGDDERFIEGVVDLSRKRVMSEIERTQRDAAFGEQVSQYVARTAPDVPLVVFWAFGERAERMYPGQPDKQIDWAIQAGRQAMEAHQTRDASRNAAIRESQDQSDTLDGTPARPRRRGAREQESRQTTFVEELLEAQKRFE